MHRRHTRNERRLPIEHGEPRKLLLPARRSRKPIDLSQNAEVTLVLRSRGPEEEWQALVAELTNGLPRNRRYLTRAELARKWGTSPEDIDAVRKFVAAQRLEVVMADDARRCVVVSGTLERLERAFEVEFIAVDHPLGTFRSYRNTPNVPETIHPRLECILGLDDLPVARTHAVPAAKGRSLDRQALLRAYSVPPRLRGKGQCVAVIELGGGFRPSDLKAFFGQFGLAPPRLRTRGVLGAKNHPAPPAMIREFFGSLASSPNSRPPLNQSDTTWVAWTYETTADLEMLGAIAPEVSILLVQSFDNAQGKYHAVTSVVMDAKNAPSALSCSWGDMEQALSPSFMRAVDRWFQAAAVLGMTVCCSSGDAGDGTLDPEAPQNRFTVQFPASSPNVLACGGTTLNMKTGAETTWNQKKWTQHMASGGGFSGVFPMPQFQQAAGIDASDWIPKGVPSGNGRALPDVAGKANLEQNCSSLCAGIDIPMGGTSAAAPLWAAIVAIVNEGLNTRVGSLNALLYDGSLSEGLRDIVTGNSGVFRACKGWDACTGWGSPKAETLLRLLRG
jgi:kumamolisin